MSDPQVVVVGAGQAGLAVSRELVSAGVDHVVLERKKVGQAWRSRWDSFCLVTPNWTMSLPGFPYRGTDPEGFVLRDEIVGNLERFAHSFRAPVREHVEVQTLEPGAQGGFLLKTSAGEIDAPTVVLATGAYQRPHRPPAATTFPQKLLAIDAEDYSNPDSLPPGKVLVVGSGQTGCQIAEDLHLAGRQVFLACGRAPWGPRRVEGRDIVTWLSETTWFDTPLSSLTSPAARLTANIQLTGRGGGHDLHYRTLHEMGVELVGRFAGADDGEIHFADDLTQSIEAGDNMTRMLMKYVDALCAREGIPIPFEVPSPLKLKGRTKLDVKDLGAVIWTSGYRPAYDWVNFPVFDDMGFPVQVDGRSAVPGLYFMGVHFQRKAQSAVLYGVGEDAEVVARDIIDNRR